jgi:hypothetical protein
MTPAQVFCRLQKLHLLIEKPWPRLREANGEQLSTGHLLGIEGNGSEVSLSQPQSTQLERTNFHIFMCSS